MGTNAKCHSQILNDIVEKYKTDKHHDYVSQINLLLQINISPDLTLKELMKKDSMTFWEEGKVLYKYLSLFSLLKQMIKDKLVTKDYIEQYMENVFKDSTYAEFRNEIRSS